MNDNPAAAGARTAKSSLAELVKLAGLPEVGGRFGRDHRERSGVSHALPPRRAGRRRHGGGGSRGGRAVALEDRQDSSGCAIDARAAAAALRSPRYLKINGKRPEEDPEKITGFYELRDGRWMYLHCNFFNLRDRNLAILGVPA